MPRNRIKLRWKLVASLSLLILVIAAQGTVAYRVMAVSQMDSSFVQQTYEEMARRW